MTDEPIYGPKSNKPDHPLDLVKDKTLSPFNRFTRGLISIVRVPTELIHDAVLYLKGPKYYYYHRKYEPATPIDECFIDDAACVFEAKLELERLKMVDTATIGILLRRREYCRFWNSTKQQDSALVFDYCEDIENTFDREETNFFIKYGDSPRIRGQVHPLHIYNKQKHRMIMDRRKQLREEQNN